MDTKIDRRRHPRVLIRALVDYESEDTYLFDYSKNLSQSGIFIQTGNPLEIGDVFELKFSLPDIDKVFQVRGEVRWANTDDSGGVLKGMGIEFKNLTNEDRKSLQVYLDKVSKE